MKIELKKITIRELHEGYQNNQEDGVVGYHGNLNIRPKYQREFVYMDKQRNAVIDSVLKGFPLNVMYWVKSNEGVDKYEVLDGQQRTMSICDFLDNNFSVEIDSNPKMFDGLTVEEKNTILDYELMVYFCEGTDKEKLDWFQVINTAGEKLTDQELRNAVYTGPWLSDAKEFFSRTNCPAYLLANKYMKGSPIRQHLLEKALAWISNNKIEEYMSTHQTEEDATELTLYFQNMITWIQTTFPKYYPVMNSVDWGDLYNKFGKAKLKKNQLDAEIDRLMSDDEVDNKKGIYHYVLTGDDKFLNLRDFTRTQKMTAFNIQKGICNKCRKKFDFDEMEGDHINPWSQGGKTDMDNLQMLCRPCNRTKSDK